MVPPFEEIDGVSNIISGYAERKEGESEAVQMDFDAAKLNYEKLLEIFWRHIDPTDPSGQFFDRGVKYKTAIFYHNDKQKSLAESSKKKIAIEFDEPIVTEILPFISFRLAPDHHQNFYKKHPFRYNLYKKVSGREAYLKRVWGKSPDIK